LLIVGIVAVALLVSCGDGDDETSPTAPATSGSVGTAGEADGGDTPAPAAGDLPTGAGEDFPIAIPDGWVVDFHGRSGLTVARAVQVYYPADDFDRIVAFYDDWTEGQPDEYTRTEAGDAARFIRATTPVRQITVTRNVPDQGEQYTMLQANAASE
jgi:hypothetical protein